VRGAIELVQLRRLADENRARARIARRYLDAPQRARDHDAVSERLGEASSHHLAVALVPDSNARDEIRTQLASQRIQTSVHYPPIHRLSQYREAGARRSLPRTDAVAGRLLTLPLFADVSDEQVEAVIDALLAAV
jgi:dTDP-4-amino-4,6-dideoxygalactose transaminase